MSTPQTSVSSVIQIMRNVTGRTDSSDPSFGDTEMLGYLNDFIQSDKPQNVRLYEDRTWLEFNTVASQDTYDINVDNVSGLAFSTIQPPAYVAGFEVFWYEDPAEFYRVWPETQTYQEQRPTYVLWYDQQLIFRGPPDDVYAVKIAANKVRLTYAEGDNIDKAYLDRYLAYGASLNILSDYAEMARYAEVERVFKSARANVLARTWQQYNSQRATPEF